MSGVAQPLDGEEGPRRTVVTRGRRIARDKKRLHQFPLNAVRCWSIRPCDSGQ